MTLGRPANWTNSPGLGLPTRVAYDAEERRVKAATAGGSSVEFLYDLNGKAINTLNVNNGNWVAREVYAGGLHIAGDQTAPNGMEHSKIIARAAKETLSPLGIFRMGHSRTWIDDHGWWLAVIEFQPSGFSKGAYLNVGAMWLWHEKDYFTFDFGNGDVGCRVANHIEYKDEEQFTREAIRLASLAKDEVISLRRKLVSIHDAARYVPGKAVRDDSPWAQLSAAIALGYAGRTFRARWLFKSLERRKAVHDWEVRLKERALGFVEVLDRPGDFQGYVKETIWRTRKLLKLPERTELNIDREQNTISQPWRFRFPFKLRR